MDIIRMYNNAWCNILFEPCCFMIKVSKLEHVKTTGFQSSIRGILSVMSAIYIMMTLILGIDTPLSPYNYILMLSINVYMVVCSKDNFLLFVISFFMLFFNYSIVFANYSGQIDIVFTDGITPRVKSISMNILSLFTCSLLFFVKWGKINNNAADVYLDKHQRNDLLVIALAIALFLIYSFGFTRPIMGERGVATPIYEYSSILMAILFYYSGNNRLYLIVGRVLVLMFALQSLVFGGRVDAIQFLLVMFIMNYMHKMKMHIIILIMIFAFFILSLIGAVRGELLSGDFDVGNIFRNLAEGGFANDTAYYAYYCSESFVYVKDLLSADRVLQLFWDFVKYIFIGSKAGEDAFLPDVTQGYVSHCNGGIPPFYFYFYLGIPGILIAGLLVSFYINLVISVRKYSSGYFKIVVLWVVCSVFRWYLYTPFPLLRGVIFLSLAYWSATIFDTLSRGKHINKSVKSYSRN